MANIKYEMATKVTRGEKERWQKIGVVFMGDKGPYGIIDSIPVGFTGMVSFFEPKEKDQPQQSSQPAPPVGDDIPFAKRMDY